MGSSVIRGIFERVVGRNFVNRLKGTYRLLTEGRVDDPIESYHYQQKKAKSTEEYRGIVLDINTSSIADRPIEKIDDALLGKLEQNLLETTLEKTKSYPVIESMNGGLFSKIFGLYTLLRHPFKNIKKIGVYEYIKASEKDILETLLICKEVRTARDAMAERANENKPHNNALREWLEGPKKVAEGNLRIANARADVYEGLAFSGAVNYFINQNPIAKKKAIAFYDFENKNLYYNHRAMAALRIKTKNSHVPLKELLRVIEHEDLKRDKGGESISNRRYIFDSLKGGEVLNGLEIHTGEKKQKIYLTTRPISYVSRTGKVTRNKSFGILMFLDQPSFLFGSYKMTEGYKRAEEVVNALKQDFGDIYKAIDRIS